MTLSLSYSLVSRFKSLPIAYKIGETSPFWIRARSSFLREVSCAPIAGKSNRRRLAGNIRRLSTKRRTDFDRQRWDTFVTLCCRGEKEGPTFPSSRKIIPDSGSEVENVPSWNEIEGG